MSKSTPKPRSPELSSLISRVASILDGPALATLLAAGLERQKLERIVARAKSAPGVPFSKVSRGALAEKAASSFGPTNEDASFDMLRELDRATENERAIVSSMPEGDVTSRFVTDAALRIKRHGAQLVWAMVRDVRLGVDEVRDVLNRYLVAVAAQTDEITEVGGEADERKKLMTEIGRREMALVKETARVRELEARVQALELELAQRAHETASDTASQARRDDKRMAHLERQASLADALKAQNIELENENDHLKKTVTSLRATLAERSATPVDRPAPLVEPPAFPSAETAARVAGATSSAIAAALGTPLVSPPKRTNVPRGRQRIGVLVDVANIAGAARLLFDRAVDYHRLLALCCDGRALVEAHAYVIDKGLPGVDAFVAALRHGSYKVHTKRPKTFADGTVKADWDLAIAVDALGLAERCDTIVLASGDGDFLPLVQGLKRRRVAIEAVAFAERTASELTSAVDQFTALDQSILQAQ